jgi:DNA polymerase-3 subunit delta
LALCSGTCSSLAPRAKREARRRGALYLSMKIATAQIDSYISRIAAEKISGCLIFGPESSLVNYRFNEIAKKISPDLTDAFLVANISKERLAQDKAILADEFFSFSMLGGRKLIMIQDADIAATAALKILFEDRDFAKKSENFILIQGGDLDKSSALRKLCEDNFAFAAIACYEDNDFVIKKFIESELAKKQLKPAPQAVDLLFEKFGKNRQVILSELEKIAVFCGEGKILTTDLIEKITSSESEISANEFVLNFAAQKFDTALKQAERLFKNDFEPITLIRFLTNYLQKLYFAKTALESKEMDFESAVKSQWLFFKTEIEFRKHLKTLSLAFLTKNLSDLQKLELKIKSGLMPSKLLFASFIQGLVKLS